MQGGDLPHQLQALGAASNAGVAAIQEASQVIARTALRGQDCIVVDQIVQRCCNAPARVGGHIPGRASPPE